jgi:glycosyltransferase involved in cell wall biosynthesis
MRLLNSPVLAEHFDIRFLNTTDPGGTEDIGRFSLRNVLNAFEQGLGFMRRLASDKPDAIYVPISRGLWGFIRDLLFLIPARIGGVKVIVHLRAGRFDLMHDNGALGRMVGTLGMRCADRAIVLGETLRGVFGNLVPADEIRVIPNGLDLEGWEAERWQAQRGTGAEFRIAYLANIYHDKGAHVLLAALPAIIERVPNVRVTFAGMLKSREYFAELMAFAQKNGLERYVEFIGQVDDAQKKELFSRSDLAVFVPVKPEGLPWVVLEAMASGLPVIGSPQGTMIEVIADGETGFIVPSGDSAEVARRVVELAGDPELRARLGRASRRRVEERFSEHVNHGRLADVVLESMKLRMSA